VAVVAEAVKDGAGEGGGVADGEVGFPGPGLTKNRRFSLRWRNLRVRKLSMAWHWSSLLGPVVGCGSRWRS